jgi:hypothetical protein
MEQQEPDVTRCEDDEKGIAEAHAALDQALSVWPEVTLMTTAMRGIRQRNHLAEKVRDAMGGHPR